MDQAVKRPVWTKGKEQMNGVDGWSNEQMEMDGEKGKGNYFESPLAGPLPPSKMGPAWSPFCPFWPLLPLGFLPF